MSDGSLPETSFTPENVNISEQGRVNIGVYTYNGLKHLGDHFNAVLEEQSRNRAEGRPDTWGQSWHHEQMRRWSRDLFLHLGIAQGKGLIDEGTANGLVSLVEDTPSLSQGVVDKYLDNWNGSDEGKARERAYGRHNITDAVIQILASGRSEIAKTGHYAENPEGIINRVDQASLSLKRAK